MSTIEKRAKELQEALAELRRDAAEKKESFTIRFYGGGFEYRGEYGYTKLLGDWYNSNC